jgi:hypothetical protein
MDTPDASGEPSQANITLEQAVESLLERQKATETFLKAAEDAVQSAEMRGRTMQLQHEEEMKVLLKTIERLSATDRNSAATNPYPPTTRKWKPPTWDGQTTTFRDYIIRIRSSYRTHSGLFPTQTHDYEWDTIYDSIPYTRRARMRNFWEKGGDSGAKDPEDFLAALEKTFSDTTEKTKALEALVTLRHEQGQPWHEHQLYFDELLHGSHGDRWPDDVKIEHLKKTFSEPVRSTTVAMKKVENYFGFCEETARIMTNYEETSQFKAEHRIWLARRNTPERASYSPRTAPSPQTRTDQEGDTIMTATRTLPSGGVRPNRRGPREIRTEAPDKSAPRAKWVTQAELKIRKEKGLCFRCGASGHRVGKCPYRAAVNPTKSGSTGVHSVSFLPILEDSKDDSEDSGDEEAENA